MEKIVIKWNKERMFFEAFMPNGDKLPSCLQITLSDNFGKKENEKRNLLTATIEVFVTLEA
jgi:hypothetical protein